MYILLIFSEGFRTCKE